MKRIIILLTTWVLLLAACASPGVRQDCLHRKNLVEEVAGKSARLQQGLKTQEVRALLGEPNEIVAAKGVGKLTIWKYFLVDKCKDLGMIAPTTELFFIEGRLADWQTYVR
jgi:hypothetical protein